MVVHSNWDGNKIYFITGHVVNFNYSCIFNDGSLMVFEIMTTKTSFKVRFTWLKINVLLDIEEHILSLNYIKKNIVKNET